MGLSDLLKPDVSAAKPDDVAALGKIGPQVRILNLRKAGLRPLGALPRLREPFVWKTAVTPRSAAKGMRYDRAA